MLSDMSYSTPSFDIPIIRDSNTFHLDGDLSAPLGFEDLFDIACEFEFARTITHIWPCEEESNTGLDAVAAAIVPTQDSEERPMAPPSPVESISVAQEADLERTTQAYPAPYTSACPERVSKNDKAPAIKSTLQGWSPPNDSQFLDLDDNLILPQPVWNSLWLATSPQSAGGNMTSPAVSTISDERPTHDQGSIAIPTGAAPKRPPMCTINKIADGCMKKSVPIVVQPLTHADFEARPTTQPDTSVPAQTAITSGAKTPQFRFHAPSTLTAYARPPRGGIPPHIARSVTKANILRVEKERKVMQDAFSSTNMGTSKKPSVLRRTAKVEREVTNGGGGGEKLFDSGESNGKERRAAKRARV